MKSIITITLLLSAIFSYGQKYDTVKVLAFVYVMPTPHYYDDFIPDSVQSKGMFYISGKTVQHRYWITDSVLCLSGIVKAWEIRIWKLDPEEAGEICVNCQPYPHHVEYLEFNKFNSLSNVWEAKQINW